MFVLSMLLTTPAPAADLLVPAAYPTVGAALAVAQPGDDIVVAPGTYCEAIVVAVDGLVLRGGRANQPAVLDGSCLGTAAVVEVAAGIELTLEALVIDGANSRVPLLVGTGGSVVGTDVAFLYGYAAGSSALVDLLAANTGFDCHRCFFCGGEAGLDGGAMRSDDFLTITESVFALNTAADDSGAVDVRGGAVLHNNTFIANSALGNGGALRLFGGNADLVNNIFVDHTAGGAYAVDVEGGTASGTTNIFHLNALSTDAVLANTMGATDPLLAGRAGTCATIDAELTAGSPAIGTGDPSGVHLDIGARRYDVDGDGHGVGDGDCDDTNPLVFPGAVELCNRIDDDCDGFVDDDDPDTVLTDWFIDNDGDGYGSPNYPSTTACAPPDTFYVDNADDCDDFAIDTHPYAEETCDPGDEDCDGLFDADDPSLVLPLWYADYDNDGYGDTSFYVPSCEQPTGFVDVDGDCEPGRSEAYPQAPELCNGLDDDCDPTTDDVCDSATTDTGTATTGDTGGDEPTGDSGLGTPGTADTQTTLGGTGATDGDTGLVTDAPTPPTALSEASVAAPGCRCSAQHTTPLGWALLLLPAVLTRRRRG